MLWSTWKRDRMSETSPGNFLYGLGAFGLVPPGYTDPDLILYKGMFWSVEPRLPEAQAEAISDGGFQIEHCPLINDSIVGRMPALHAIPIAPGKLAALVVLDLTACKAEPSTLVNITIESTMTGGRWVYEA
jgi:hypothetical protein